MAEPTHAETSTSEQVYDLRALHIQLLGVAKFYWCANLYCKAVATLYGIVSTTIGFPPGLVLIPVFLVTVLTEMVSLRSDSIKLLARSLHDKLDFQDALGWPIENHELRTIISKSPKHLQKLDRKAPLVPWFENTESNDVRKPLENLEESSWWTEELSRRMFYFVLWTTVITTVVLFVYFVGLNLYVPKGAQLEGTKIGIGLICLLPSLGVIKLIFGYYSLWQSSLAIREEAQDCRVKNRRIPRERVMKLWFEYRVKRSSAPMIPTWIYNRNRDLLNGLWEKYK
jgi:hypothetical protein